MLPHTLQENHSYYQGKYSLNQCWHHLVPQPWMASCSALSTFSSSTSPPCIYFSSTYCSKIRTLHASVIRFKISPQNSFNDIRSQFTYRIEACFPFCTHVHRLGPCNSRMICNGPYIVERTLRVNDNSMVLYLAQLLYVILS